jgi:predicted metalloprotease with PDZ domain
VRKLTLMIAAVLAQPASAQAPPALEYRLSVDPANLRQIAITLHIARAPDTVRLAMAAHPEYDDRYRRYVTGFVAESRGVARPVVREDSAVWRVAGTGGDLTVRYTIALPEVESPRAAWRPYLTPTGGLVGGPHSFMYLLGAESSPSSVVFNLPPGWGVTTGLVPGADGHTFRAASAAALLDSPALVGRLSRWDFSAGGVPHHIAYWRLPSAAAFDTSAFASNVERIAREVIRLFGSVPYRDFTYQIEDDAYGGLEHGNSVTLGITSESLSKNAAADLDELAHEYIHTWNLMYLRPAGFGDLSPYPAKPVSGLWLSEGLTLYYADVVLRRARLPGPDSTRVDHLAGLIERYLSAPGNARLSAEVVSQAEYSSDPLLLGDYVASTHLQGELIGTMLDLVIRHATAGRRSMDDVMRTLIARRGGSPGFTTGDVERAVAETCRCAIAAFFDAHVRHGNPIDFNRYLRLAGLRMSVKWSPAVDRSGRRSPDTRIQPNAAADSAGLVLRLYDPASAWGRAGLHSGDRLIAINGEHITTWRAFRTILSAAALGDTLLVDARHGAAPLRTSVILAGYERPTVAIDAVTPVTSATRVLRARWLDAAP